MRRARASWACAALLACLAALAAWSSRVHSNAYDELAMVGAGYSYVETGRFRLAAREHPPLLMWLSGACLLPLHPRLPEDDGNAYRFGRDLLYHSGSDPMSLLFWARLPSLALALLLGFAVFSAARRRFGEGPALGALALFCFEPLLVAHASLLSLDLAVAAFGFIAWELLDRGKPAAGAAALAFGFSTKISTALLIPAAVAGRPKDWKHASLWAAGGLALASLALWLIGAPSLYALAAGRVAQLQGAGQGTNYLLGRARAGWFPEYYLVAFLSKATIPFLILLALAATARKADWRLLVPAAAFFLAGTLSHKQLGIRYVLPAYPFLCVFAAAAFERRRAALVGVLLAWHAAECLAFSPRTFSYFNELAGGRAGGHRVLADSNLDWGMELPLLHDYIKEQGSPELVTAIASDGDLDYWLGPHQDLIPDPLTAERPFEHLNSTAPARELLLVSASYRVGFGLADPAAFAWLDRIEPQALLAGSLFVYDITRSAWAHNRLGALYLRQGRRELAIREAALSVALDPGNPLARRAYEQAVTARAWRPRR